MVARVLASSVSVCVASIKLTMVCFLQTAAEYAANLDEAAGGNDPQLPELEVSDSSIVHTFWV